MNNDDYKHKIDEHRKPISLDNESRTNTRVTRRSTKQNVEQVKPRRNLLLPILFTIFILIPVGFLIYIQVFYQPNTNQTAITDAGEFEFEENEVDSVDTNVKEEPEETNTEDSSNEDENTEPVEPVVTEDESEGEVTEEEQEEVVEEQPTETETSGKTHIVQPNETLYRIAMNYYNSPDAVEKIKDANGLTSDSISEGQKLILP
ncbi:LysM peptidoglycan-binding domain-containing protein [Paenisporosarcina quisquiliarum]|uniref:LysM peptidoglycan-binding domain-containing protein n=1 Tax=Paenisporosarcina quisquiliarum TaxID=365346 RepID=UPI003735751D